MTNLVNLIRQWEASSCGKLAVREYKIRLSLRDAAKIAALAEMYPRRNDTELISELLAAALDELVSAMPYIPGIQVVSEDEEGNPIFEDKGPTPRFLELYRKQMRLMETNYGSDTSAEIESHPKSEANTTWNS
jgi:hypothetical protein